MDGIINVLKPPGMTSHDVVYYIRKLTGQKKIGHAGTLDPNVAGVLPLFLGKATRLTEFFLEGEKGYRGEIIFGLVSDTQDAYGKITVFNPSPMLSRKQVVDAMESFCGVVSQIPPMVSAIKHQGKRLYELARKGQEVERQPREVLISRFFLVEDKGLQNPLPTAIFDVTCSKGTYVRTLCHDLGQALGCGAIMSYLVRTSSGPFKLEESISLETLAEEGCAKYLLPLDYGLEKIERITVNTEIEKIISYGRSFESIKGSLQDGEFVRIYNGEEKFLAIYRYSKETQMLLPYKVFL